MAEYPPGWTCEKTLLQFEYYLSSRLQLAQALAGAEHLEACLECAEQLMIVRFPFRRPARG